MPVPECIPRFSCIYFTPKGVGLASLWGERYWMHRNCLRAVAFGCSPVVLPTLCLALTISDLYIACSTLVFFFTLGLSRAAASYGPPRCQGTASALRRSSSASDSFGPIRRLTNRPRFSKKMVLFEEEIQCRQQKPATRHLQNGTYAEILLRACD